MKKYQLVESTILGLSQIIHFNEDNNEALILHNNKAYNVTLKDLFVLDKKFVEKNLTVLYDMWEKDTKAQIPFDDYIGHSNLTDGYFTKTFINQKETTLIIGGSPRSSF